MPIGLLLAIILLLKVKWHEDEQNVRFAPERVSVFTGICIRSICFTCPIRFGFPTITYLLVIHAKKTKIK
jgi:hypothetical protein